MNVSSIRWERVQGYPVLRCVIDGREAVITHEQKLKLLHHRLVFLGENFPDYVAIAPPALAAEIGIREFPGFTDDPQFFGIVMPFLEAVRSGEFEEKVIL